ncbi:hypothetical protein IW152_004495 [Coemansia sp. BCRC 34962]|nr:hypothetical protein IW152_004495 [Coemansia sp. BCRC 34962]
MLGYSGADVIELLSDDSLSDAAADNSVLEVIAAPGRNAWPGSTPSVSQTSRVLNLLTPNTPGTPDLPSPSAILGLPRRRELSSDSGETANVDYSDAVATEIIDSSSSDEELALGPKLAARAIHSSPKLTAAPSQPAPGEETQPLESSSSEDHPMFERLREEEIKYRLGQTNATCGIAWEMLVRRKWDSRTNLYVPVACAKTCKVKSVAMVVLLSDRFVELLANNRVETLLEIWRGSLATKRLFVVVVGLQKYLRRAAAVETREFARQLRTHIKDGVATALATSSKGKTRKKPLQQPEPQKQLSEEAVEEAVLRLQMTRPWATWFTQCSDTRELGRLLWQTTMDLALAEYNGDRDAVTDDGETVELAASQPDGTEFITKDVASALNVAVIRTGTDLADSWIHALTQIPKVTLPVAQSIAAQYPTPKRLFEAWQRMASEAECEQLLAQLSVASATAAGRRLGSAMSTRVYRVFNEPDPGRPFAEL